MYKICEICKKVPATVHLTDIKNNVKTEIHMCEKCAAEKGINIKNPLSLQQLFGKKPVGKNPGKKESLSPEEVAELLGALEGATPGKASSNIVCPHCGISWEEFKKGGRFGCSFDYDVFSRELRPILDKMHASPGPHVGKCPRPSPRSEALSRKLEYQRRLKEAIAREDYREAARLRDSIQALEK